MACPAGRQLNAQGREECPRGGDEGREKMKDHILEDSEDLELNSEGEAWRHLIFIKVNDNLRSITSS